MANSNNLIKLLNLGYEVSIRKFKHFETFRLGVLVSNPFLPNLDDFKFHCVVSGISDLDVDLIKDFLDMIEEEYWSSDSKEND